MSPGPAAVDGHEVIGSDNLDYLGLQVRESSEKLFVDLPLPFAASALPVVDEVIRDQLVDHAELALINYFAVEAFDKLTIGFR